MFGEENNKYGWFPYEIFINRDWIFEPKIDGTRCIAHISNGIVELQNRRLSPMGYHYPEITNALKQAASNCVLDGEMTVFFKRISAFRITSGKRSTNQ